MAESAANAAAALQQYNTHVRLYVQEAGAEQGFLSGTSCEIRGYLIANGERKNVSVDLPEKHNFANENGVAGQNRVRHETRIPRVLPANFNGVLYEEGNATTGDRFFTNANVDWNTPPKAWMDGRYWYFTQTVSNDQQVNKL